MQTELKRRLDIVIPFVEEAANGVMNYFQSCRLIVERKADRSVVTQVDRETEKWLRAKLQQSFPADAIVGEEFGNSPGTSGFTWYIDPIDGTDAFMRGVPLFGTLLGLESKDQGSLGVIFLPAIGEMVYAATGLGAWWVKYQKTPEKKWQPSQPIPARVSKVDDMKSALFCTSWMQSFLQIHRYSLFSALCGAIGNFRGWGDCYGYLLVATGRAEVMIDPVFSDWDGAPMQVILEEAGGRFTDIQGHPTFHGKSGVATNGILHEAVMEVIRTDESAQASRL